MNIRQWLIAFKGCGVVGLVLAITMPLGVNHLSPQEWGQYVDCSLILSYLGGVAWIAEGLR